MVSTYISEAKIKFLQEQKSKNNEQIAKLVKKLEEIKQKYKIVRLHKDVFNKYVEIKSQIEKIHKQNQQIDHRIFQLDKNKYYEETKLKLMYENLLKGLGFSTKKSKENWILFEFNGNEQTFNNNLENIATALLEKKDREIAESVEDLKNEMSVVIEK